MNNFEIELNVKVEDGRAYLQVLYNNTKITEAEAREIKEAVLETVYNKIDEFQNLKK